MTLETYLEKNMKLEPEEDIIAPYQIVEELEQRMETLPQNVVEHINKTKEAAEEIRENFKDRILPIDEKEDFDNVMAVDGSNSSAQSFRGWFFGIYGAVCFSTQKPLIVNGDIVSCPAGGEMVRYLQALRAIAEIEVAAIPKMSDNDIILMDGSAIPLGAFIHRKPTYPFEGYGRYDSHEETVETGFFNENSAYKQFFAELTKRTVVFLPKHSVSRCFTKSELEGYNIPEGVTDTVLFSLILKEREYVSAIPYSNTLSPSDQRHLTTKSMLNECLGKEIRNVMVMYYKPTRNAPAFKVEFHKSKLRRLPQILALLVKHYSPVAHFPIPLWFADKLAKSYSALKAPFQCIFKSQVSKLSDESEAISAFFAELT